MLSEQNFKQRQLLLSLQDSWADFKEHIMQPGVDLLGSSLGAIRTIDAEIRKLSIGPESWARGSKTTQDNSEEGQILKLS